MGSSESCCKKDDVGLPPSDFKEIVHMAPILEEEEGFPDEPISPNPELQNVMVVPPEDPEVLSEHKVVEPDLSVDPSLLRGVLLHRSLRHFGRVWKTAPNKLNEADYAYLSRTAKQVDELGGFDVFLSHTWQTSGKLKAWALLLHTAWPCVLICWATCILIAAVLFSVKVLPNVSWYYATTYEFTGWVPAGPWLRIAGIVGILLGLAMGPYRCKSEMCFIDVVSINQKDLNLQHKGVYGLAGFLSKSRELRILWSPELFSRLWCIFELAAFHKANPNGRVVLAPLYVEAIIGMLMVGLIFLKITFFCLQWIPVLKANGTVVNAFVSLVPILPLAHYIRHTLQEKARLLAELHRFNLNEAYCKRDFDREFILTSISQWYGSQQAFTEYVRGPIFQELKGPLSGIHVPVAYWAVLAAIELSSLLEFQVAFYRAGAPMGTLLSQFFASTVAGVLWRVIAMRLALKLCDLFSSHGGGCCPDLLKTVVVWLLTCTFIVATHQLGPLTEPRGVLPSALNALFSICCTFLALGGCRKIAGLRRP